ncbi:hypothetical protein ACFPOE_21955, partial [Caenimonas terrae]
KSSRSCAAPFLVRRLRPTLGCMKRFLPILIAAGGSALAAAALITASIAAGGGLLAEGIGGWLFCLQLLLTFGLMCIPFALFAIPAFLLLMRFQRLSWYWSACVGGLVAAMPVTAGVILFSFDPGSAEAQIFDATALTSVTVTNHGVPTTAGWEFLWNHVGAAAVVGAFAGIVFCLTLGLMTRRPKVCPGAQRNAA